MTVDLTQLNEPQREAVEHTNGPILVLAGAGSGKTRVVTCRTALLVERGVSPETLLVVTFTNKAAEEMRQRVLGMVPAKLARGLTLSTFHAFGARLLRRYIDRLGYPRTFSILDQTDQLRIVRSTLEDLGLKGTGVRPEEIKHIIGLAKRERTTPVGLGKVTYSPLLPHAQRVFQVYQENLRALGGVDFDDLLGFPLQICAADEEVRQVVAHQFRYIMVDEFQDTNSIQVELLKLLAGYGNIMAVGDDDQSIYAFQGAKAGNILQFERVFEGARIIKLEDNYRSTKCILDAANSVIAHNPSRHVKLLRSVRGPGGEVRFISCADEHEEADFVAGEIAEQIEQEEVGPDDFAVLYRIKSQALLFEEALRAREVPYHVVGSTELFDRAEVRDWLAYLAVLVNPRDDLSLRRILNVPKRSLGTSAARLLAELASANHSSLVRALQPLADHPEMSTAAREGARALGELLHRWAERFHAVRGRNLAPLASRYLDATGLPDHIRRSEKNPVAVQKRVDNLNLLVGRMADLDSQDTLADYLARVRLDSTSPDWESRRQPGVALLTLHSAKGLEFPRVYLVGFEQGLLPHKKSLHRPTSIAEERRLCYVGMTRASERLTLTAARTRTHRNQRLPRQPSIFLEEIGSASLLQQEEASGVQDRRLKRSREYLAAIRAMLDAKK